MLGKICSKALRPTNASPTTIQETNPIKTYKGHKAPNIYLVGLGAGPGFCKPLRPRNVLPTKLVAVVVVVDNAVAVAVVLVAAVAVVVVVAVAVAVDVEGFSLGEGLRWQKKIDARARAQSFFLGLGLAVAK